MKLLLSPLILEASVTETRREVRSLSGGIFRVSCQRRRWPYENGKELEPPRHYTRSERGGKANAPVPCLVVRSEESTIP